MIFDVLRYAAPVAFGAVGESVGQRSGVINIGLEGVMLASAFTAAQVAAQAGPWAGLAAAAMCGWVLLLIISVLVIEMGRDQVVIGTAVNLVGLGLCGTLHERAVRGSTQLTDLPSLPALATPLGKIDPMIGLLLAASGFVGWAMYHTAWGLRLRAAGESPGALAAAGYSVSRARREAMMIAGLAGGLGGGYYALGIAGSFAPEMIAGRGFVAIALVTFGRWRPMWIIASTILVGFLEVAQYQLQMNQQSIPKSLLIALPYVLTLGVLVVGGRAATGPAALGKPYRGMR